MQKTASLIGLILMVFLAVGCGESSSSTTSNARIEGYFDGVYVFLEKNNDFVYVFLRNENNWPVDAGIELAENYNRISLQPMQEYEASITTGSDSVVLWLTIDQDEYQFSL